MRQIPWSVWRLMAAYSLMMGGTALTVLIAGIISLDMAPSAGLATLPIALAVVGVAVSTLPTGKLLGALGRRTVFLAYGGLAISSALLCAGALQLDDFALYCLGTFLMGWAGAAGHQYRFAALELVPPHQAATATSVLLFGGIFGAFIGPELAVRGRHLLPVDYVGSYLLLVVAYGLGMVILFFYRERSEAAQQIESGGRPLHEILRQPVVLLAIASGATAYGVMSFLMTATPLSMHEGAGHSLEATKWVIQSHIAGMYLPSLLFGWLLSRLGERAMLWLGIVAFGLTLAIAVIDNSLLHYWLALVLLGVGWNFLFLMGTNLLARGYRPEERYRVQAVNDFIIFTVQAIVSLGSGWMFVRLGWENILWTAGLPVLAFGMMVLLFFRQRKPAPPAA